MEEDVFTSIFNQYHQQQFISLQGNSPGNFLVSSIDALFSIMCNFHLALWLVLIHQIVLDSPAHTCCR